MASKKCENCGKNLTNCPYGCIHCASIKNVNAISSLSTLLRVFLIIASILLFGIGIANVNTKSYSYTTIDTWSVFFVSAAITFIASFIFPILMDWCALMLNNLHEINAKLKK